MEEEFFDEIRLRLDKFEIFGSKWTFQMKMPNDFFYNRLPYYWNPYLYCQKVQIFLLRLKLCRMENSGRVGLGASQTQILLETNSLQR